MLAPPPPQQHQPEGGSGATSAAASGQHAVTLPSHSAEKSFPVFESFCELRREANYSPDDYVVIDAATAARQAVANNKVRDLLRSRTIRPPQPLTADCPLDYIKVGPEAPPAPSSTAAYESTSQTKAHTHRHDSPSFPPAQPSSSRSGTEKRTSASAPARSDSHNSTVVDLEDSAPAAAAVTKQPPPLPRQRLPPNVPPWMPFLCLGRNPSAFNTSVSTATSASENEGRGGGGKETQVSGSGPAAVISHNWEAALDKLDTELDFFGRLHEEICALLLWLDPTVEELLLRQRVLARIHIVATSIWPNCEVKPFGSYYTGLWLPTGDVDVNISNVHGDPVCNLRLLTLCLAKLGIGSAVEVIHSARVPIAKYIDSECGIPVDVSFNTDSALPTSQFVRDKLEKFPWLRPLVVLMKVFLQQRFLNETYKGGIGSYLLVVMCLSFLQQHRGVLSPGLASSIGLGHLFLDFLQLYGLDFNFDTTGISVRKGGSYFLKTDRNWFQVEKPHLFAVESPLDPTVDCGRNSYDIRTVRTSFRQTFLTLTEKHLAWEDGDEAKAPKKESILKHAIFLSDPLFRHRHKMPTAASIPLSGSNDWVKHLSEYFDLPISRVRPIPVLSPLVVEQVLKDFKHLGRVSVKEYIKSLVDKATSGHSVYSSTLLNKRNGPRNPFAFNPLIVMEDQATLDYKARKRREKRRRVISNDIGSDVQQALCDEDNHGDNSASDIYADYGPVGGEGRAKKNAVTPYPNFKPVESTRTSSHDSCNKGSRKNSGSGRERSVSPVLEPIDLSSTKSSFNPLISPQGEVIAARKQPGRWD